MVYVERTKMRGREYYRLVYTSRRQGRVTHRRKYIGTSLPPKERLDQLKKEFMKEAQGERYKYLTLRDVEAIEQKKITYCAEIKTLSPLEEEKRLKEFIIRFTYDSSKLAGVAVTLRQTSLILKEGIIPKDIKNLRTVKELENHEKGILAITKYKGNFNLKFMKKLHRVLFTGIDDSIAGKTRDELHRNVKLAGTSYVPPSSQELKKELTNFLKWYRSENRRVHPLELAALIHLKIISLQLFVDGNSRLSRLLMNWVLWKKKYPLVEIPMVDVEKYCIVPN